MGSLDFIRPHFRVLASEQLAVQEVWMQSCQHSRWNISRYWSSTIVFRGEHFPHVRYLLFSVRPGL